MKSLLGKLGVILLIRVAIFGSAEVWGADWRIYGKPEADIGEFYYDAGSISSSSKNIVSVLLKTVYFEKEIARKIKELGKSFENLSYTEDLVEVNCLEKKRRFLKSTSYSKGGDILYSYQPKEAEWSIISPDSMGEALYRTVCK